MAYKDAYRIFVRVGTWIALIKYFRIRAIIKCFDRYSE